jgi:guanine deaminase
MMSGMRQTDETWLGHAIELAVANVANQGGPFGAVVVQDDTVIGSGANRVTADLDPTAHAEVVAIRDACRRRGDFSLAGTTLYASCEPCPLCLSASLWSRVDRVIFAADRHAAAAAGFDDALFHGLLGTSDGFEGWPIVVNHIEVASSEKPFDAWRAHPDRIDY